MSSRASQSWRLSYWRQRDKLSYLMSDSPLTKAVVPIAGLGTRMLPISAAVPKALLPLVDGAGCGRAAIHWILSQATLAGISHVALVVSPDQVAPVNAYFQAVAGEADLPLQIEYLVQDTPAGFGDAVLLAEEFAAGEPIVVLLGDHVFPPGVSGEMGPIRLIASAWRGADDPQAVIGVQVVEEDELSKVGVCRGEPLAEALRYRCTRFVEKPALDQARDELHTPGLDAGTYLAHSGIYAFSPEIFTCLHDLAARRGAGELELACAQSLLLQRFPSQYILQRTPRPGDIGSPAGYAKTFLAFHAEAERGPDA